MAELSREEKVKLAKQKQAQKLLDVKNSVVRAEEVRKIKENEKFLLLPQWKQDLIQNKKYAPYIVPNDDGLMVIKKEVFKKDSIIIVPSLGQSKSLFKGDCAILLSQGEERAYEALNERASVTLYLREFKPFPDGYELLTEQEKLKLSAQLGNLYDTNRDHIANEKFILLEKQWKDKIVQDLGLYYPKEEELLKSYIDQTTHILTEKTGDTAKKILRNYGSWHHLPEKTILQKITGRGLNKEEKAIIATILLSNTIKVWFNGELESKCWEYFTKKGVNQRSLNKVFDDVYTKEVFVKIAQLKGLKANSAIYARRQSKKDKEQQRTR